MKLHRARVGFFGVLGLRQVVGVALAVVVILFFLPALLLGGEPLYGGDGAQSTTQAPAGERTTLPSEQSVAAGAKDKGRTVRLQQKDGTIEAVTMADYLWGVVAAEMPATFEGEALKAQACAARTYTAIKQATASQKHPGADICAESTCCQAYVEREGAQTRWGLNAQSYTKKIEQAVAGTDAMGICFEGQPIQALFFSCAAGQTVDAVEVWGNRVAYLKSVDSPEGDEVPNYHSQVILTAQQVKELTQKAYPGADLSGAPAGWFGQGTRNEGGAVRSIPLGGVTLTGGQIRTLFSLRSATFRVSWEGDNFLFDVTGYGHGVGMSQYGANAMAKQGKTFGEILTWYYTDTQVQALW